MPGLVNNTETWVNEDIERLLSNPECLIKKKPFTRGTSRLASSSSSKVEVGEKRTAVLPRVYRDEVTQDEFVQELDPNCHRVLFDDNIPSITAKTKDNQYVEIEFKKMAIPFQKMIVNKHVLHLCGYGVQHTLNNLNPTEEQRNDFAYFKQEWLSRNLNGLRTRFVRAQMSYGDAGLLFYFDRNGRVKARVLSYEDGYVICSHNDRNGDRLMECVYYRVGSVHYIDCYTDSEFIRFVNDYSEPEHAWVQEVRSAHRFNEIPLITKRGDVPWNDVQTDIEVYEIIYNIFVVIQKRHGWGLLYIKGQFKDQAKKIAGAVVLNDSSMDGSGDAKYLQAPTPEGMLETLRSLEETIQKGSGTTFILPKDISMGGDVSGVAIQIAQSLDNEEALNGVIEWQNVASKMTRLFCYGLSSERVNIDGDANAITRYCNLNIHGEFKQWRPRNDIEYNNMLVSLSGSGLISKKTGIEKNTESTPDEEVRVSAQEEAVAALEQGKTVEE